MIYLIDNGYRIKSALNTLVNQVKCPEVYNKCLGCKAKGKVEVNDDDNDNQRSFFADQGTCFADVNANDNVNQGTCFTDVNDNVNGETWTKSHNNDKLLPSLSNNT